MPVQTVLLLALLDRPAQQLLQHLEVDLPLSEGFREQRLEMLNVVGEQVGGLGFGIEGSEFAHGDRFPVK